jgi:hypothetical protein
MPVSVNHNGRFGTPDVANCAFRFPMYSRSRTMSPMFWWLCSMWLENPATVDVAPARNDATAVSGESA